MDLRKGFDTVDREIPERKLDFCGVKENSHDWFTLYLRNRSQRTIVNNILSETRSVLTDVVPGSILATLLFLVYVIDLPICLECTTPDIYDDVTWITATAETVRESENLLDRDIENLTNLFRANKLSPNAAKT